MKALAAAVETLFPEPARPERPARSGSLLASAVALGCALAPLLAMIEVWVRTA